jgi:hypothetical protein
MNPLKWIGTGIVAGAMLFAPAISMGAVQSCATETGTYSPAQAAQKTSDLLKQVQSDAQQAEYHANVLRNFADNSNVDWQAHVYQLNRIRSEVDDMGRQLCRLESTRAQTAARARHTINRIAPLVRYMADNTDDAINYVNAHQGNFWVPAYGKNVKNIGNEARAVSRRIGRSERVASRMHGQNQHNS